MDLVDHQSLMDREDRLGQIDCPEVLVDCNLDLVDRESRAELDAYRHHRIQGQSYQRGLSDRGLEDIDLFHQCYRGSDGNRRRDEGVCSGHKDLRNLAERVLRGERDVESGREGRGRGEGEREADDHHVKDRDEKCRDL